MTTACSRRGEAASTAMKVPGNWNPWPAAAGASAAKYAQGCGHSRRSDASAADPAAKSTVPARSGHLRRRVAVMAKPVAVPVADATAVGTTSHRPEVVALVRRTPWK